MVTIASSELCVICKGKGYCGRIRCPILEKAKATVSFKERLTKDIFGASPPGIFIGRTGYPRIFAGIMLPNEYGNTSVYDSPELWHDQNLDIEQILKYRFSLINSRFRTNVDTFLHKSKFLDSMQELAMSKKPVDMEVHLKKEPKFSIRYDSRIAPMGPSGEVKKVEFAESPKISKKVEYFVNDYNVKAHTATLELFLKGVDLTTITRILSAGLLGLETQRRLVPTRWAITAVDSQLSNELADWVKQNPILNEIRVHSAEYLGNIFNIILFPKPWCFELVETYCPGSVWLAQGYKQVIVSDWERHWGRRDYARNTGGAYYASKFAVLEHLNEIGRQASALVLREVRRDYWAPLGVWLIRETVREALKRKPKKFSNLDEVKEEIGNAFITPVNKMVERSNLLEEYEKQTTLDKFFK